MKRKANAIISIEEEMYGELMSAYHEWHYRFINAYYDWSSAEKDTFARYRAWEEYTKVRDEWDQIESKHRRKN